MDIDPSKVNSLESFSEFLAALLSEYTPEKQKAQDQSMNIPPRLDVTLFLECLQMVVDAHRTTKRDLPVSWESFAHLLLMTKRMTT